MRFLAWCRHVHGANPFVRLPHHICIERWSCRQQQHRPCRCLAKNGQEQRHIRHEPDGESAAPWLLYRLSYDLCSVLPPLGITRMLWQIGIPPFSPHFFARQFWWRRKWVRKQCFATSATRKTGLWRDLFTIEEVCMFLLEHACQWPFTNLTSRAFMPDKKANTQILEDWLQQVWTHIILFTPFRPKVWIAVPFTSRWG